MARPKLNAMPHVEAQREAARRAREADRAPLQDIPVCDGCGLVGAGMFGFGDFSDGRAGARYACDDALCQASVQAMATGAAAPPEPVSDAILDDLWPDTLSGRSQRSKTRRAA